MTAPPKLPPPNPGDAVFTPRLAELAVSYSYDIKANIDNYENAGVHITRSERWNVEGLTQEEADALYVERYEALKAIVDPLVEGEYANLSIFAAGGDK